MRSVKYAIVLERAPSNWSAHAPDVPGCITTGATREEVEANMREALVFHLEGLCLAGLTIPEPRSEVRCVAVEFDPDAISADADRVQTVD